MSVLFFLFAGSKRNEKDLDQFSAERMEKSALIFQGEMPRGTSHILTWRCATKPPFNLVALRFESDIGQCLAGHWDPSPHRNPDPLEIDPPFDIFLSWSTFANIDFVSTLFISCTRSEIYQQTRTSDV